MNKISIGFALVIIATVATAQTRPLKKLYAYSQASLPGKKSNHPITPKVTYRLFITVTPKEAIAVTGVWVKNNYYRCNAKTIAAKHVVHENTNYEKKILVPKTSNTIIEVLLTKQVDPAPRPGSALGNLLQANEVVFVYTWKGKEYFSALKKITVLEPFAAM